MTSHQSMKRIILAAYFVVLALGVKISAQQVFGTAHVIVQNASTPTSLLAGQTPANLAVPTGWALVAKEDFEGQAYDCLNGGNGGGCYCSGAGCPITSSQPHGTGHSLQTNVVGSGFNNAFGKVTPSATEYYISVWRFDAPGATLGADVYFARVRTNYPDGSQIDCKFDPQDSDPDYITITAPGNLECEGSGVNPFHNAFWPEATAPGTSITIRPGQWVQYEYDYRPSSCTGSTMNGDGFFRFYQSGTLKVRIDSTTNAAGHIGGCPSMNSAPTVNLESGGEFTYPAYITGPLSSISPSSTCTPNGTLVSGGSEPACRPFSNCPRLQQNGHTCWGSQPNFSVYTDDVILLKR
jgi:hypothetical protein